MFLFVGGLSEEENSRLGCRVAYFRVKLPWVPYPTARIDVSAIDRDIECWNAAPEIRIPEKRNILVELLKHRGAFNPRGDFSKNAHL